MHIIIITTLLWRGCQTCVKFSDVSRSHRRGSDEIRLPSIVNQHRTIDKIRDYYCYDKDTRSLINRS